MAKRKPANKEKTARQIDDQLGLSLEEIQKQLDKLSPEEQKKLLDNIKQEMLRSDIIKISEAEWTLTNPGNIASGTDRYYASLTTEIVKAVFGMNLPPDLPAGFHIALAKSAAAYLEDIKSDFGVWSAVRSLYFDHYGRKIPFYDVTEEYYDDDINIEDIKILVWQVFNRVGSNEGRTFSPYSPGVDVIADTIFDILVDKFDEAPENNRSRDVLRLTFRKGDYFETRSLALWLSMQNPLTAVPFALDHLEEEAEKLTQRLNKNYDLSPSMAKYVAAANYSWLKYTGLTGDASSTLLSKLARYHGFDDLADKLLTVKVIPLDVYAIVKTTSKVMTLKNRIGEQFEVMKDPLEDSRELRRSRTMGTALVKFGDVYYANGMCVLGDKKLSPKDNILAAETSPKILQHIDKMVAAHNGRRVFYCRSLKDIESILRLPNDDASGSDGKDDEFDNYLVMLSSTDGVLIKPDCCNVFKDKENPFYQKYGGDKKGMDAWAFIANAVLPDDVIEYIVAKKLLPSAFMVTSQGKAFGKKVVQDNMDFFFHFYRVDCYSSDFDLPEDPTDD